VKGVTIHPPSFNYQWLGRCDYNTVLQRMQHWVRTRTPSMPNTLWALEHHDVYTIGQSATYASLVPLPYPLLYTDRGGDITYHGPGQLIIYILYTLSNHSIRSLITAITNGMVCYLASQGISSYTRPDAPGVYLTCVKPFQKVASIGLRIHRRCTYHGIALNVSTNLNAFRLIRACGLYDTMMVNAPLIQSLPTIAQSLFICLTSALNAAINV
jgi:lipoyl(octanoyl) transferase